MNKQVFTGKTIDEAINNAMIALQDTKDNLLIKELEKKSGGLFKSSKVEIQVIRIPEIIDYIKKFLFDLIKNMGMSVQVETKIRDNIPYITVYSDDNGILIGKNGRTIDALAIIIRQALFNEIGEYYQFQLDVGEYKLKQQHNLERLAKQTAKEVYNTKIPVKLEPMNSYERRIIHTVLVDNDKIITTSEGEEPNRCVVIKVKED